MSSYPDPYSQERFYLTQYDDSSEWPISPDSGTLMSREPSGASTNTAYSSDMTHTPSSDFGIYNSQWPSVSVSHQDLPWLPLPNTSHDINPLPASHNHNPSCIPENSEGAITGSEYYDTATDDPAGWWRYYDFVVNVNPPCWQLKPQFTPSAEFPSVIENTETTTGSPTQTNDGKFVCLAEGCTRSFRRKADLERHLKNLHRQAESRDQFYCDYKKCDRAQVPFHRHDHKREHYRDVHLEDLMRRGPPDKQNAEWWRSRDTNPKWWRCSRCLCRVRVEKHNYECPNPECKASCETERIAHRKARELSS
ncbi:hypothetical protein GGR50DRAFT_10653 [Xylaria sp. CBS 124048]|nr:hypothetical protein GGR50DRAFT_10653 [Xylaria sp. CBS 124048]